MNFTFLVLWMKLHLAGVEDSREDGGDVEIVVALLAHCCLVYHPH